MNKEFHEFLEAAEGELGTHEQVVIPVQIELTPGTFVTRYINPSHLVDLNIGSSPVHWSVDATLYTGIEPEADTYNPATLNFSLLSLTGSNTPSTGYANITTLDGTTANITFGDSGGGSFDVDTSSADSETILGLFLSFLDSIGGANGFSNTYFGGGNAQLISTATGASAVVSMSWGGTVILGPNNGSTIAGDPGSPAIATADIKESVDLVKHVITKILANSVDAPGPLSNHLLIYSSGHGAGPILQSNTLIGPGVILGTDNGKWDVPTEAACPERMNGSAGNELVVQLDPAEPMSDTTIHVRVQGYSYK